jgi:catechol 2,3-dioxygenase-like lactoylglutathione lyase family enzyme
LVDDGSCWVSGIRHRLGAEGRGIVSWALRDLDVGDVDGLPTSTSDEQPPPTPAHPNGVVSLDHLVVMTPDIDRTTAAIEAAGLELRRVRDTDQYGPPFRQAFFKLGEVVLEVIGPVEPRNEKPARFFGLAFTVADLDATAAYLGPRLRPPKDAVQPGRQIATLDKAAGSSVAMAFMSPAPEPSRVR